VRFVLSLSFSYSRIMSLSNIVGAGHRRSALERHLRTAGAANVVTRLTTQAVTGRARPMEVHQHYGYELHLLLTDTSCIHRVFATAGAMRRVCTQLERGLVGLCSCGYDANRMVTVPYEVERCVRALPIPCMVGCDIDPFKEEFVDLQRWEAKETQRDQFRRNQVCLCRCGPDEPVD